MCDRSGINVQSQALTPDVPCCCYFTCNYSNLELPMDRWFGSFHYGARGTMAGRRILQDLTT